MQVVGRAVLDEIKWRLHRYIVGREDFGLDAVAQSSMVEAALVLWLFAEDRERVSWDGTDVYGDDMARLFGWLTRRPAERRPIDAMDEDETCALGPRGGGCAWPEGTVDGHGTRFDEGRDNYQHALATLALHAVEPGIRGFVFPWGGEGVRGVPLRSLLAELDQWALYAQFDAGPARGGFGYGPNSRVRSAWWADASVMVWMAMLFAAIDGYGEDAGHFVPDLHRARAVASAVANQGIDGAARYRNAGGRGSLMLTGGALLVMRGAGVDLITPGSTDRPFAPFVDLTEGEMRAAHDAALAYTAAEWETPNTVSSAGWNATLYWGGDPTCAGGAWRCAHLYGIMNMAKALHGNPRPIRDLAGRDPHVEFVGVMARAMFDDVRDDGATPRSDSTTVEIERSSRGQAAPVADAGGPTYVIGPDEALRVDGRGSYAPDAACGDAITAWRWDLDGDGDYDDAAGAEPDGVRNPAWRPGTRT